MAALQALDGQRVLGAHVDVALRGADREPPMAMPSITLCGSPSSTLRSMNAPGVALVGVAEHVLLVALRLAGELPLQAGREARAAAAAQAGAGVMPVRTDERASYPSLPI
jgi:hypothetical protein